MSSFWANFNEALIAVLIFNHIVNNWLEVNQVKKLELFSIWDDKSKSFKKFSVILIPYSAFTVYYEKSC